MQGNGLCVRVQPAFAQSVAQPRQGTTQAATGAALVVFGVEQRRQRVAAVPALCDGQVGQEGQCLAPPDMERHTIALDARCS